MNNRFSKYIAQGLVLAATGCTILIGFFLAAVLRQLALTAQTQEETLSDLMARQAALELDPIKFVLPDVDVVESTKSTLIEQSFVQSSEQSLSLIEDPVLTPAPPLDSGEPVNLPAFAAQREPQVEELARISAIFTPEVRHWEPEIIEWSEKHGLDPNIIATLMQIESCGNPAARSVAGAQGLFQVMPHHFSPGENMLDPTLNAERAVAYYKEGLKLHAGDRGLAFAGYNAGHGMVMGGKGEWPQETIRYYNWSVGIYQESQGAGLDSPTLQAWLRAGGDHLCRTAAEVIEG